MLNVLNVCLLAQFGPLPETQHVLTRPTFPQRPVLATRKRVFFGGATRYNQISRHKLSTFEFSVPLIPEYGYKASTFCMADPYDDPTLAKVYKFDQQYSDCGIPDAVYLPHVNNSCPHGFKNMIIILGQLGVQIFHCELYSKSTEKMGVDFRHFAPHTLLVHKKMSQPTNPTALHKERFLGNTSARHCLETLLRKTAPLHFFPQ